MTGIWFKLGSKISIKGRLLCIDTLLREQGVIPGAHSDEYAIEDNFKNSKTGLSKIGCRTSDHFIDILNRPYDDFDIIDKYTAMLMSNKFDKKYMKIVANDKLQETVNKWDPINTLHIVTKASSGKCVEISRGSNTEVIIIFNFVKDTALDRYKYLSKAGVQAFVVDMWYIDKIANAMAASRPNSIEVFNKLKHAMVAFQLATYLTLCDGTQRPVILTD